MEPDIRGELKEDFELLAAWRRQKALEYPDDIRNLQAAEHLERLAATTKEVDIELIRAVRELFEGFPDAEEYSQMMREIGFQMWPDTAEEFCRAYIAARTS